MCRLRDAELNCVSTKMRLSPACKQLLIGMSISRYLPPNGTAGFDRMWVSGNSLVPRPPPRISVSTSFMALSYSRSPFHYLAYFHEFTARCSGWLHRIYTVFTSRGGRPGVKLSFTHFFMGFMMFNAELCYAGHSRRFS